MTTLDPKEIKRAIESGTPIVISYNERQIQFCVNEDKKIELTTVAGDNLPVVVTLGDWEWIDDPKELLISGNRFEQVLELIDQYLRNYFDCWY